jgi:hypothetical protein
VMWMLMAWVCSATAFHGSWLNAEAGKRHPVLARMPRIDPRASLAFARFIVFILVDRLLGPAEGLVAGAIVSAVLLLRN